MEQTSEHRWIAELRARVSDVEAKLIHERHSHLSLSRERIVEIAVYCEACRAGYATAAGRPCPAGGGARDAG